MKPLSAFFWKMFLVLPSLAAVSGFAAHVDWIKVNSSINPITAKYIMDSVDLAEGNGAECLVIELDTPGGLMESTWAIDKRLLASEVPVVVYVSPSGGRAASAGVFISYAAHVAAMAPSTNIGAAHPVNMVGSGGDSSQVMMDKVVNDAVAHIRGLADQNGRNGDWAEEAIRNSVSITEKEALEINVINLIAKGQVDLLNQLDGLTVMSDGQEIELDTASARIVERGMDWRHQILNQIANPNIAFILLVLAGLGIYFEFSNPGSIFPGVIGVICGILFLFASQVLSINAAGVLLILLAIVFFIVEVYTPTFGILTAGGIISFVVGALMLFKTPGVKVSLTVLIPVLVVFVGLMLIGLMLAIRTRLTKPTTGKQGLVGEIGVALQNITKEGQVSVHGEVWKAVADERIKKGDQIEVLEINRLKLRVKKVS
ncbi:nodulation protein NfeD [bacterium]|nr:nodulation protein NfeD [bacterium]